MDTAQRTPTAFEKVCAWVFIGSIVFMIGYAVYHGAVWLTERDALILQSKKEDCVARGGRVTEHVGGWTVFDCKGPTRFSK